MLGLSTRNLQALTRFVDRFCLHTELDHGWHAFIGGFAKFLQFGQLRVVLRHHLANGGRRQIQA